MKRDPILTALVFILFHCRTGFLVSGAKSYSKNARVSLKVALNETKTKVAALNETRRGERLYLNPLLDTPVPSHCDLTPKYCDLQCCSDKDCTKLQKEAFNCVAEEDVVDHKHNFWSCKEKTSLSSWHPFMCYVTDNSPFLGRHFLAPPEPVTDVNKFTKVSAFQFPSESSADPEVDAAVYHLGARLHAAAPNQSATHLRLPLNTPGTHFCARTAPVRFLKNTKINCLTELTAENCDGERMSGEQYVDKLVTTSAHGTQKANTTVRYLCLNRRGENFVRIMKRDNRKINYGDPHYEPNKFNDCDILFLNSFFDPKTRICYNALLGLDYKFTWNGTNVTHANVTFWFADVPYMHFMDNDTKAPKMYLSQKFSVSYEHALKPPMMRANSSVSNATSSNSTVEVMENAESEEIQRRSGNPGYTDGQPLIFGTLTSSTNETNENTTLEWEKGYFNLVYSNIDGDCVDVVPLALGFDALSSCRFKLSPEERHNCTLLSETLADVLGSLYFGEHAAIKGDLVFDSQDDVVQILWPEVETISSSSSDGERQGCLVAAGLSIKVLFSQHWVAGAKLTRLAGLRVDPLLLNVSMPAPDSMLVSTSLKFSRLDPATKTSRFWAKMMEHSENSWLEIIDPLIEIFKHEDNMEEVIIFWTLFIATLFMFIGNTQVGVKK